MAFERDRDERGAKGGKGLKGGRGGRGGKGRDKDRDRDGDRDERTGQRKYRKFRKDKRCRFCRENVTAIIDYKDINVLQKLCTAQGKLFSRKRSGNCAYHQRAVKRAVKRARFIALLPYVGMR